MFGDKKKALKDSERSLISETVSIDGTVNSSGAIDISGLVKGPVFSKEIVVKETGSISGSVEADIVEVHGHLDGKISAENVVIDSLFTTASGFPFFLEAFSLDFENKKSPVLFDLEVLDFLIYPSMSAPFSVLRLFENSMSPFTTPVEPITTFSAEIFPSKCP